VLKDDDGVGLRCRQIGQGVGEELVRHRLEAMHHDDPALAEERRRGDDLELAGTVPGRLDLGDLKGRVLLAGERQDAGGRTIDQQRLRADDQHHRREHDRVPAERRAGCGARGTR
jgi:hypothetical protein